MKGKRALVIAGFDPSGGAGLLMDVKVLTLLGFRACAIPSSLTFQSSKVFEDWVPLERHAFERMLWLTLEDEVPVGVKIGMLGTPEFVEITASILKKYRKEISFIVLDPVLKATLKKSLFAGKDFLERLKRELFPLADIITPNVKEAEILTGLKIDIESDIEKALFILKELGVLFPVITGVEKGKKRVTYFLNKDEKIKKIGVKSLPYEFHGTGCAFSSALLAYFLKGYEFDIAVKKATFWVYRRLLSAEKDADRNSEGLLIFL